MTAKRGYYSLVQFCPNPSRAEAVNLGVILFCPDARFLEAKMAAGNKPAMKLVGQVGVDKAELNAAKRAIEHRLKVDGVSFQTPEDFRRFAETRANVLKLTAPRPIKVVDPAEEILGLFEELVGGRPARQSEQPTVRALEDLFRRLHEANRASLRLDVTIPIVGRHLRVPYAYRNGALNLVKPQLFHEPENQAIDSAMRLAIEGDLLQKHRLDSEEATRLIVVSSFNRDSHGQEMKDRVTHILRAYEVRNVTEDQVPAFVAQVEREAHWD
ncbi:MAG: DUF3037 domain-containing protein [Pirellulales bacterium]